MKRAASFVLALLIAAALAVPALADVIWEPIDDFYTMHRDECVYVDSARYEAQTDTQLVKTPDDLTVVEPLPAGSVVIANHIWQGDEPWAAVELFLGEGDGWREGWVRLADFRKLYGEADFEADHAGDFIEVDGDLTITEDEPVYFWTFPGSGVAAGQFGGPDSWMEEETVSFNLVWTDEDGNDWAYLSYFYGLRNVWVYLPDMANGSLPGTAPRYADSGPAAPGAPSVPESPSAPEPAVRSIVPVIAVVIAIAAVTAILIVVFTRRRRPGE